MLFKRVLRYYVFASVPNGYQIGTSAGTTIEGLYMANEKSDPQYTANPVCVCPDLGPPNLGDGLTDGAEILVGYSGRVAIGFPKKKYLKNRF
jgi:hypothetical protein